MAKYYNLRLIMFAVWDEIAKTFYCSTCKVPSKDANHAKEIFHVTLDYSGKEEGNPWGTNSEELLIELQCKLCGHKGKTKIKPNPISHMFEDDGATFAQVR